MRRRVTGEEQAASNLWLLMSNVATRFGRESLRGLNGCKFGMQGARVLIQLLDQGAQSCSALAVAVGLEATALSHLLRSLADQDLIQRARAASDQRTIEVSLTTKGADVAQQCRALNIQTQSVLVEGLEAADLQSLHAILMRMTANLDALGGAEA